MLRKSFLTHSLLPSLVPKLLQVSSLSHFLLLIQVMRITAPVAPYDDDKIRDVFHLIVSSFEHLDDESSYSYAKRRDILDTVSRRRETVAEAVGNNEETETQTHKRVLVESGSLHKDHDEMEKLDTEGEPSCPAHKSCPEPGDLQQQKVLQPYSFTHQFAKMKQSIIDTITSVRHFRSELETKEQSIVGTLTTVRQFRSEVKKKEDNLEASLQEVDVLGMRSDR